MEVHSRGSYPSNALSNFAGHRFVIDDIQCNSMEGFVQSLKFKAPDMQEHICSLVGMGAKKAGSGKNWYTTQTLWWRGQPIHRSSEGYQELISRAYDCMFEQSESFRKALQACGKDARFTHSIGKKKENETVMTEKEFCSQLHRLQRKLFNV